ncbi:MAG: hypothetical protein K0S28_2397, partial [Paucimonas sp.]|nr:hypothetical protein [Paucimonas sp.]
HLVLASPIRDRSGNCTKWYGTATDIHDRKILEEQTRSLAEQLAATLKAVEDVNAENRDIRKRYECIAEATSIAIWDWDLETDQIWWNEGYEALFGIRERNTDTTSATWSNYIHPDDKARVLSGVHAAIAGTAESWSGEYRYQRKNGQYARVIDRGVIIRNKEGRGVRMVGGMNDLTSQKESEENLARLNRALTVLSRCNKALVHATDESALLDEICNIAVELGGYSMAWVGYAENDERRSIVPQASAGTSYSKQYINEIDISWSEDDPRGKGPGGESIRTGKPVICRDIHKDPVLKAWSEPAKRCEFGGFISLPLIASDRTFGLLALYSAGALTLNEEELRLLQDLANNLAFGIKALRTRDERQRIEAAVLTVSSGVSATSGVEFFEHLARSMADAVGAQGGFVARLVPGNYGIVRTLGAVVDGMKIDNFEYHLSGTPCELLQDEQTCAVPRAASQLFPMSARMAGFGAEAYVGARLDDSKGRKVGLLYVLFREPLENPGFIQSMLQIFASRASAELERFESDSRIRDQASLLDKAQDAIIVCDTEHRIQFWNKGAERLYGWSADDAIGKIKGDLLKADRIENEKATIAVLNDGEWSGELAYRRKDGTEVPIEAHWSLVRDDENRPQSIFTINSDISQRKSDEREIEKLAFFDSLTGLPNRRQLYNHLDRLLYDNQRSGDIGAVLFIDLDNFKSLNDSAGHDKGDLLLRQVAGRLKLCTRRANTVARLGGDEFVIVLYGLGRQNVEAARIAEAVAEKVLASFGEAFQLDSVAHHCTASVGVALFSDGMNSVEELLKRADLALYQAKGAGRNAIRFFDPKMQEVINARVALEADIRDGLRQSSFSLYYQPQTDVDGRLTGTEALLRWRHSTRGIVAPSQFIPLAEDTGQILLLGEWVLDAACAQLAKWRENPQFAHISIAINVSVRQFRRHDFVRQVTKALERNHADPTKLKLELTESLLIEDLERTVIKMDELKCLGVSFSLDDFGTGYSSLAYLKRLPLDQLKIDQSFV